MGDFSAHYPSQKEDTIIYRPVIMIKFVILFVIYVLPITAAAQHTLKGCVREDDNSRIEGAQVILSAGDSIMAFDITDAEGMFMIKNVSTGEYNIGISCIGHYPMENRIRIGKDTVINVMLVTNAIQIDSVVVNGKKKRNTGTGFVYYLSEQARKIGDPFKALEEVPGIVSDYVSQTLHSADGKSMTVLIDGTSVNTGIAPIDPERIASVEVHEVVSAKYMRTGVEKVINIRLKKTGGLYSFYEISSRHDFPANYTFVQLQSEVGTPKFSIYGCVSPDYSNRNKIETESTTRTEGYTREEENTTWNSEKNLEYELMLKYRPAEKDYIALSLQGEVNDSHTDGEGYGLLNDDNGYTQSTYSSDLTHIYSGALYHKHEFTDDMEIESTMKTSLNTNKGGDNTTQQYAANSWYDRADTDVRQYKAELTTDYSWDINNDFSLEAGNTLGYIYNRINQTQTDGDYYRHRQWSDYLYACISGSNGRLGFMLSGGYEAVWTTSGGIFNRYISPCVSASVGLDMGRPGSLRLDFSQNISTPMVELLSPYNTSTDSLIRTMGNPMLTPQKSREVGIDYHVDLYKAFSTGLSIGYTRLSDMFSPLAYMDNSGIYNSTYTNKGHFDNMKLTYDLSFSKNGNMVMSHISYGVDYYTGLPAKRYVSLTSLCFLAFGKFRITASLLYTNRSYTTISTTKNLRPETSASVSYSINDNLLLSAGVKYFAGNPKTITETEISGYECSQTTVNRDFRPWLLLRWTLRKNHKRKIEMDNDMMPDMERRIRL